MTGRIKGEVLRFERVPVYRPDGNVLYEKTVVELLDGRKEGQQVAIVFGEAEVKSGPDVFDPKKAALQLIEHLKNKPDNTMDEIHVLAFLRYLYGNAGKHSAGGS